LGTDSTPVSKIKGGDYSVISEAGSVEMDFAERELSQQDLAESITK
jgi:hypothetical protein